VTENILLALAEIAVEEALQFDYGDPAARWLQEEVWDG